MKAEAVILDVDGTLWDTTPLVAGAWTRALADASYDRHVEADELRGLFGKPMDVIADELLPELDEKSRYQVMRSCMAYEEELLWNADEDLSYPGVRETIAELSSRRSVCIVSNCQSGYIELCMHKLSIEEFIRDTECYGDTGLYKAENISRLLKRNHFRTAVYVGDIQGDEDAAHEAGISFVHAAYGFGMSKSPEAVIHDFRELTGLL